MIPTIVPDEPLDWRRAFVICCADAERLAVRLGRVHAVVEKWRERYPLDAPIWTLLDEIDAAWREVP
jgi:hypothetical protein